MIRMPHLFKMKQKGEKFCCLTAYDSSFAHLLSSQGIEVILVGDSLGMVMQGHDSTVPVTMDHMVYHTEMVARGNQGSMLMGDMPFMSYATPEQAMDNAARLMAAGAHVVKLEGGAWLVPTVRMLTERGIPVCCHLGLTPQSVHILGGYKAQGKTYDQATRLKQDALALEAAGAQLLVLECIPSSLAKEVTESLAIPVIGIGAGRDVDAQILVLQDMLGITPGKRPRFSKAFIGKIPPNPPFPKGGTIDSATPGGILHSVIQQYINEVKSLSFPAEQHEIA